MFLRIDDDDLYELFENNRYVTDSITPSELSQIIFTIMDCGGRIKGLKSINEDDGELIKLYRAKEHLFY